MRVLQRSFAFGFLAFAAAVAAQTYSSSSSNASGAHYVGAKFHADDPYANLKPYPDRPIDQGYVVRATNAEELAKYSIDDFPPERRDVFYLMDQVADDQGHLHPLSFGVGPNTAYDSNSPGQKAVYGRNTWLLWCGGNEDFWDWLASDGYGVLDFLKMLDSRKRESRFRELGLVNQPGMKATNRPGPYGLFIDSVEKRVGEDDDDPAYKAHPIYGPNDPMPKPGPDGLTSDGVDPKVYGYPSGVIGLRLFPNPKFDAAAKAHWNAEAFYSDPAYAADPKTVRPYLVGMSCAICHVAAHPLNPPLNPEEPKWSNLSSIVGNQYFRTSGAFGSRVDRGNFLWHYLASQQPGTIDTSMVSSDQINNANAMNPVLELPARLTRATLNPAEIQQPPAQTFPGVGQSPRLVPRVLMDGADSVGVFGALARVYLNIGTYHDEWDLCTNPVIGFVPQKPFSIDVSRHNSIYWRVNEAFRVNYLAAFFTWDRRAQPTVDNPEGKRVECSTAAMLLKNARNPDWNGQDGAEHYVDRDDMKAAWSDIESRAVKGSQVFARNCMICHSSKQPDGFKVEFALDPANHAANWAQEVADPDKLTLPMAWEHWEEFKKSPAYAAYLAKAVPLTGDGDAQKLADFEHENYFSTDLRIPVSLTSTYAGRALATNAMEGQVWSEFTSATYKNLPAVGPIAYYDPFAKKEATFQPQGHGPGYYRVPSLVSIWATAPLLHNNSLGMYIPDSDEARRVSVKGRLEMFDDAIEKLLWKDKRGRSPSAEGGLRDPSGEVWHGADPGWIFRTDMDTEFRIPASQIRHLVIGILPGFVPHWLGSTLLGLIDHPWILPFCLALLSIVLALCCPRFFCYLLILTGVALLVAIPVTGANYLLPWEIWLLPIALLVGGLLWVGRPTTKTIAGIEPSTEPTENSGGLARAFKVIVGWCGIAAQGIFIVGLFAGLWVGRQFVNGQLGDLRVGPFPKGVPVNALMNLNPEASRLDLLAAGRGLAYTFATLRADDQLRAKYRSYGDTSGQQYSGAKPMTDQERLAVFEQEAGPALMRASKCPDYVLDRGHYFGEALTDQEKRDLIAFLKTL